MKCENVIGFASHKDKLMSYSYLPNNEPPDKGIFDFEILNLTLQGIAKIQSV